MLFWICVSVLVIGIIASIVYSNTSVGEWCDIISITALIIGGAATVVSLIVIGITYFGIEGEVAANHERYEILTYQYENAVYENDNDLGKRELFEDIQEWNEDLARNQKNQGDFWIGIFVPDVFDEFEFIEIG